MKTTRLLSAYLIAVCALMLTWASGAFAFPVTWTLSNGQFADGGTASGYFVYDADTDSFSSWSISVGGGVTATFPAFIYNPTTSSASDYPGTNPERFYEFDQNGTNRGLRFQTAGRLSDAGGAVTLGSQSVECYNCAPYRYLTGTLTGTAAPAITSANATTFTVGTAGTFTVQTTGVPTPTLAKTGSLPSGVIFTDNGDGTATLSGTPAAGTGGTYALTITASNGVSPDATQSFTLTVNQAPAITSANATTFTVGTAGTFTVQTSGAPTPTLAKTGTLPSGVIFTDNGDGTATLSGTPAAGTGGTYALTITASNGVSPDATQSFTLTVNQAPAITSANATTFTVGTAGTFTVTATGTPTPSVTYSGSLPSGVIFTDNGDGTATLSGTPAAGTGGTYALTITDSNNISPDATQSFTLTVNQAPAITSANATTFTVGTAGTFTVTATGTPTPSVTYSGSLPSGVIFTDNGDGTATLSGTPAAGTAGTYALTITASNGVSPDATQSFTLTVNQVPAITSANATTFIAGASISFTFTSSGFPTASLMESGTLPSGVTFVDNGDGTATLAGIPGYGTVGTYSLTVTASNGVSPDAVQTFTLTIVAPVVPSPTLNGFGRLLLMLLLAAAAAVGLRLRNRSMHR